MCLFTCLKGACLLFSVLHAPMLVYARRVYTSTSLLKLSAGESVTHTHTHTQSSAQPILTVNRTLTFLWLRATFDFCVTGMFTGLYLTYTRLSPAPDHKKKPHTLQKAAAKGSGSGGRIPTGPQDARDTGSKRELDALQIKKTHANRKYTCKLRLITFLVPLETFVLSYFAVRICKRVSCY